MVELRVVPWTENKYVGFAVRAVVSTTEGLQMVGFRIIVVAPYFNASPAYLALVPVQGFESR